MKDKKVINRTHTFQTQDEYGRLIHIKVTLEMEDPITKEFIPLPEETPDLRCAMTRAAYEAAIAFAEERKNDNKTSS